MGHELFPMIWCPLPIHFLGVNADLEGQLAAKAIEVPIAEMQVKAFAKYARSHWSIENSLHWVLDVAFREDDCQIENPTAAANLSAMNRLAVSAFQADTKVKRGSSG